MEAEILRKMLPSMAQCQGYFDEIQGARDTVIYALWCSGELSYYKLLLITGMEITSLNKELKKLIDSKDVKVLKLGDDADCFTNVFTSNSFRLNRS